MLKGIKEHRRSNLSALYTLNKHGNFLRLLNVKVVNANMAFILKND